MPFDIRKEYSIANCVYVGALPVCNCYCAKFCWDIIERKPYNFEIFNFAFLRVLWLINHKVINSKVDGELFLEIFDKIKCLQLKFYVQASIEHNTWVHNALKKNIQSLCLLLLKVLSNTDIMGFTISSTIYIYVSYICNKI